eukprot:2701415-Karenia_brevis.AAC.1
MVGNKKWIHRGRRPDGRQCYSRVCGRLVQISDGHIRHGLYEALQQFGEVVGIYVDVIIKEA